MWCPRCLKVVNPKGEEKQDPSVPDAAFTIWDCPECLTFLAMVRVDKQGNVRATAGRR